MSPKKIFHRKPEGGWVEGEGIIVNYHIGRVGNVTCGGVGAKKQCLNNDRPGGRRVSKGKVERQRVCLKNQNESGT